MQKGFAPVLVLVGILVLVVIAGGAYYFGKLPIKLTNNNPKACTQEAKQCPDGSYVSRSGPNCEFAPCPSATPKSTNASPVPNGTGETVYTEQSRSATWKTYIGMTSEGNNGPQGRFRIKYPSHWKLEGSVLYPFEGNKEIFLLLGDGARGGPIPYTKKTFPAGVADYVWIESAGSSGVIFGRAVFLVKDVSYSFGVEGLPLQYSKEYQEIFDQILSTFKFIP